MYKRYMSIFPDATHNHAHTSYSEEKRFFFWIQIINCITNINDARQNKHLISFSCTLSSIYKTKRSMNDVIEVGNKYGYLIVFYEYLWRKILEDCIQGWDLSNCFCGYAFWGCRLFAYMQQRHYYKYTNILCNNQQLFVCIQGLQYLLLLLPCLFFSCVCMPFLCHVTQLNSWFW